MSDHFDTGPMHWWMRHWLSPEMPTPSDDDNDQGKEDYHHEDLLPQPDHPAAAAANTYNAAPAPPTTAVHAHNTDAQFHHVIRALTRVRIRDVRASGKGMEDACHAVRMSITTEEAIASGDPYGKCTADRFGRVVREMATATSVRIVAAGRNEEGARRAVRGLEERAVGAGVADAVVEGIRLLVGKPPGFVAVDDD